MPHKITKVTKERIYIVPPTVEKVPKPSLPPEKIGVTDRALAIEEGNEIDRVAPNYALTAFNPRRAVETGIQPSIDRNPYNFVALAESKPWSFPALKDAKGGTVGHSAGLQFNGLIEFTLKALTPVFVPEGFPFQKDEERADGKGKWTAEDLREIPRRFCRMPKGDGEIEHYAIPGASFKGVLRSMVEAAANARFGVANKDPHPPVYRRRVFRAGLLQAQGPNGDWPVEGIQFNEWGSGSVTVPNKQGLLGALAAGKLPTKQAKPTGDMFVLEADLWERYLKHIKHPHYERHAKDHAGFYAVPPNPSVLGLELVPGEAIYFTANGKTITNFGKNPNYLWPASESLYGLMKEYLPGDEASLDKGPIDMAEYLFGKAAKHQKEPSSHPWRGHVRVETLWGPEVSGQEPPPIELAPLTSPETRGKSRPLYLAPAKDSRAASFDDRGAKARGRKFYWHQPHPEGKVWPKHRREGDRDLDKEWRREVLKQCPPPLHALGAGVEFTGRLHFSNLTPAALGALLYVLTGNDPACWTPAGDPGWALHVGKGKPRGLGSMSVRITGLKAWMLERRYTHLRSERGTADLIEKIPHLIQSFAEWVAGRAGTGKETQLTGHDYLKDFERLHRWPGRPSFRYYPVNFSQYSWLPGTNDPAGNPAKGQPRPVAMRQARYIEP